MTPLCHGSGGFQTQPARRQVKCSMMVRGLLLCALLPACCAWTGASSIKSPCKHPSQVRRLTAVRSPRSLAQQHSPPMRLAPLMDRFTVEQEKELSGKEADDAMKADFDFDPVLVGGVFAAFLAIVIGALVLF